MDKKLNQSPTPESIRRLLNQPSPDDSETSESSVSPISVLNSAEQLTSVSHAAETSVAGAEGGASVKESEFLAEIQMGLKKDGLFKLMTELIPHMYITMDESMALIPQNRESFFRLVSDAMQRSWVEAIEILNRASAEKNIIVSLNALRKKDDELEALTSLLEMSELDDEKEQEEKDKAVCLELKNMILLCYPDLASLANLDFAMKALLPSKADERSQLLTCLQPAKHDKDEMKQLLNQFFLEHRGVTFESRLYLALGIGGMLLDD